MPVISPNAFAPPASSLSPSQAANDTAATVPAGLREKVRRLERAHSGPAERSCGAAAPRAFSMPCPMPLRFRPGSIRPAC